MITMAASKYALWLGPFGPSDKENQVKMFKSTDLGTLSLWNGKGRDPYQTVGSGSISNWKADPDSYQIEMQDPDPYQKV